MKIPVYMLCLPDGYAAVIEAQAAESSGIGEVKSMDDARAFIARLTHYDVFGLRWSDGEWTSTDELPLPDHLATGFEAVYRDAQSDPSVIVLTEDTPVGGNA
jgi:hypothetical protein